MALVNQYFDVLPGTNIELVDREHDSNGINFVARTSKNNGVVAKIKQIPDIEPNPKDTISVAVSGSVMESFLQKEPYYSSYHLYVLKPKIPLSDKQLLYYCMCLKANKYKYNYGRQADKTLSTLVIPSIEGIPYWVENITIPPILNSESVIQQKFYLTDKDWDWFYYDKLFSIIRGKGARKIDIVKGGETPLVTSIDSNNGIVGYVTKTPVHEGNVITVNRNGSIGQAYYQSKPFCSTEDVHVFMPKFPLNKYNAMFIVTVILKERFRYSYGRKWGIERMNKSKMKLPIDQNGKPNWQFMEDYIQSLPYSSNL